MTTVVIPVYDDVTQLDFTTPHQFLSMIPDINVVTASIGGVGITAQGLTFEGLSDLESISACDVLCVPGGLGCFDVMEAPRFMAAIRRLAGTATYVTSVCSGSLILGAAGLLEGRRAATHWAWFDLLATLGAVPTKARVVRDENIITGGGVTAGADFALTLIAELRGDASAQSVQLALEYSPEPPFHAGSTDSAPREIVEGVTAQMNTLIGEGRARVAALARRAGR